MKRFLVLLVIALAAIVPAVVFRFSGWRPNPVLDMAVFERSTVLERSKLTAVPVPNRLYSFSPVPLELAPPERPAL